MAQQAHLSATKKNDLSACMLGSTPKHRVNAHVICIGQITDRDVTKIEWQKVLKLT